MTLIGIEIFTLFYHKKMKCKSVLGLIFEGSGHVFDPFFILSFFDGHHVKSRND